MSTQNYAIKLLKDFDKVDFSNVDKLQSLYTKFDRLDLGKLPDYLAVEVEGVLNTLESYLTMYKEEEEDY